MWRSRRWLGWAALGVLVPLVGAAWFGWVTFGPPAKWEGPGSLVRYRMPVVWLTCVGSAVCFYRAIAVRRQ